MPDYNITVIGKAWINNIDALKVWYKDSAPEWYLKMWREKIYPLKGGLHKHISMCYDNSKYKRNESTPFFEESDRNRVIDKITKAHMYVAGFGHAFDLTYLDEIMVAIRHGAMNFLLPAEFIRYELYRNYDSVSLREIALLGEAADPTGSLALIPVTERSSGLTLMDMGNSVDSLQAEIKQINDKTHKDIAPLYAEIEHMRREMEQKKSDMMALIEAMVEELETKKFQLEGQIFVLDSQIYSIRCFNGEVVDFTAIRNGRHAPDDTPVVLYQKLRYLDEELGQLTSIYEVDGGKYTIIEELLKHSDIAFERFSPSPKCVTVLRVSRSGRVLAPHPNWANCLESFEFHHSRRVCVLVRNGDALYAGWTDEDRINIEEDTFYMPGESAAEPSTQNDDPLRESEYRRKERVKEERSSIMREMSRRASRMFLFTILQGLLERKKILSIPEKHSFIKSIYERNPYIIFSAADNWLESNAYAPFNELIELSNQRVQEGDNILTLLGLHAERPNPNQWRYTKNDRGVGEADRTHDVAAEPATVYSVNKVIIGEEYRVITYTNADKQSIGARPWTLSVPLDAPKGDALIGAEISYDHYTAALTEDTIILDDVITRDSTCYISLEKEWSSCGARANFQIYPGEYINLTYMNSAWLLYAISSKKLGDWRIGGKDVSYAHAIRYLNKALEYVKKREVTERDFILAEYPKLDDVHDWQVALSHWKLGNSVRQITVYQAKRFAKYLKNLSSNGD